MSASVTRVLTSVKTLVGEARKALVAVVGVAALALSAGVLHGTAAAAAEAVLSVATVLGVYKTKNG